MRRRTEELPDLRGQLDAAMAQIARLEHDRSLLLQRDARTGLLALDTFRGAAQRELDRARRSGAPRTLVLFDLDGFRALNASHGPGVGDQALRAVADQLTSVARPTDITGRTGGDELAVLVCDVSFDGALELAQRVVDLVAELTVADGTGLSVSAGAAEHVRGGTLEVVLAASGVGLDTARSHGGGRLCVAPTGDGSGAPDARAEVIGALATTLTERDRYTGEHSEIVVGVARAVAAAVGLDVHEVQRIGQAALLHDIGKVAIPDQVLQKPADLDAQEWLLMREHPVIGERILQAIPGMSGVARIVRHEHESFDGSGYPDGLAGDAIPIGSRIILACDAYHAITSDRPYRTARSHADAVREIARCAGTQFDPRITEYLIAYLNAQRQSGMLV